MIQRRAFLTGLSSLIAAPAIVRAESLMKVRGVIVPQIERFVFRATFPAQTGHWLNQCNPYSGVGLVMFEAPSRADAERQFHDWLKIG
jgi:hypothetical protein